MMKRICKAGSLIAPVVAACAAFGAFAITKAEWEADNSLIPTPSASSAFFVVAPTAPTGVQSASVSMTGLDATPMERMYWLPFSTRLSTHKPGVLISVR